MAAAPRLLAENAALKAQVKELNQGKRRIQADFAASIVADLEADRDRLQGELDKAREALELFDALPLPDQVSGDESRRWIDRYRKAREAVRAALSPTASREPTGPHQSCDHVFTGWRGFPDGNGGEQVCAKCGMGAMAYTLSTGF